jgi:hypothetical protein
LATGFYRNRLRRLPTFNYVRVTIPNVLVLSFAKLPHLSLDTVLEKLHDVGVAFHPTTVLHEYSVWRKACRYCREARL